LVPLEGHWKRVNTPLRETTARERWLVRVVAALVAAAAVATVIVAIVTSGPSTPAGCIRLDVPSTMGGGSPQFCGSAARTFCGSSAAHQPPLNSSALPKCREAGFSD
jgi:hypothetical protein